MRWLKVGFLVSAAVHVAIFSGLQAAKEPQLASASVAVVMSHTQKKAKPKKEPPPKPIEAPKEALRHPLAAPKPVAPPPVAPPPDPVAAAHPALAALPDLGISLSGTGAGVGIAVPTGPAATPAQVQPRKEKVLGAPAERPAAAAGECSEDLVKAKPRGFVQPTYTDDARAAGIEGRVRVEVTIDETGNVVSAKVISGLGHGLDESAVSAARRMSFSPATRCGSGVRSTFVISMRFVLGE